MCADDGLRCGAACPQLRRRAQPEVQRQVQPEVHEPHAAEGEGAQGREGVAGVHCCGVRKEHCLKYCQTQPGRQAMCFPHATRHTQNHSGAVAFPIYCEGNDINLLFVCVVITSFVHLEKSSLKQCQPISLLSADKYSTKFLFESERLFRH